MTDERKALEEAFRAIYPEVSAGAWGAISEWESRYDRFTAMLDAGAWLSAAEMLQTDSTLRIGLVQQPDATWECGLLTLDGDDREIPYGDGPTPALALLSAILAARGQNDE